MTDPSIAAAWAGVLPGRGAGEGRHPGEGTMTRHRSAMAWALVAAAAFAPGCASGARHDPAPWADAGDIPGKVAKRKRGPKQKTELDYWNDILGKENAAGMRRLRERDDDGGSFAGFLLRLICLGIG